MNLPTWSTEQAPGSQNCTQRPYLINKYFSLLLSFKKKKPTKQTASKTKLTKQKAQEKTWNLFCVDHLLLSVRGACLEVWLMYLLSDTAWERTHFPFPSKQQLKSLLGWEWALYTFLLLNL